MAVVAEGIPSRGKIECIAYSNRFADLAGSVLNEPVIGYTKNRGDNQIVCFPCEKRWWQLNLIFENQSGPLLSKERMGMTIRFRRQQLGIVRLPSPATLI